MESQFTVMSSGMEEIKERRKSRKMQRKNEIHECGRLNV